MNKFICSHCFQGDYKTKHQLFWYLFKNLFTFRYRKKIMRCNQCGSVFILSKMQVGVIGLLHTLVFSTFCVIAYIAEFSNIQQVRPYEVIVSVMMVLVYLLAVRFIFAIVGMVIPWENATGAYTEKDGILTDIIKKGEQSRLTIMFLVSALLGWLLCLAIVLLFVNIP